MIYQKSGMVPGVTFILNSKMNIKFQVSIFKNDVARGGLHYPPPLSLNKLAGNDNQIENIDSVEI